MDNTSVDRYRLTAEEILGCAKLAETFEYGSIVIQSGEDTGLDAVWFANVLRQIKNETDLAVTLSLGERSEDDWLLWKKAGADRYLLRFETSNSPLFYAIHPPWKKSTKGNNRIEMLGQLRALGYEVGSGVMVGIPGQTYTDLVYDLQLFRDLKLDMIGLGPFLPHPETPLGRMFGSDPATGMFQAREFSEEQREFLHKYGISPEYLENQVFCNDVLVYKMIALTRLLCPLANIPSTTAVATIDAQNGRKFGLSRGANVVMPNLTPIQYRKSYEIYPHKAAIFQTPEQTHQQVLQHLREIAELREKDAEIRKCTDKNMPRKRNSKKFHDSKST